MTAVNPYAPPQSSPVQEGPRTTPAIAIVGFILALLPILFINLAGAILGIIALTKINGQPQKYKGQGLAIAAIVIGFAWFVIGILAAIAIPNFLKFQARARQSEAKIELKALYTAEQMHHAQHNAYSGSLEALEWRPSAGNKYTYVLGDQVVQASVGGPYAAPVESYVKPTAWKAVAIGNIDGDETLDVWTIDQTGTLDNVSNDTAN